MARTVVDAELPPAEWVHRTAGRLPDLNVVVAPLADDRCLLRLRGGTLLEAHAHRPWGTPRPRLDPLLLGSAFNLWWLAEPTRDAAADAVASGLRIRTGERVVEVSFTDEDGAGRRPGAAS
ncbi:hypothetical protein [Streptomyces sp. NPDC002845]